MESDGSRRFSSLFEEEKTAFLERPSPIRPIRRRSSGLAF